MSHSDGRLNRMAIPFFIYLISAFPLKADLVSSPESQLMKLETVVLKVDKSTLTATLWTVPRDAETLPLRLKDFRIAIGKAAGDKFTTGDNRTPEGIYFTEQHIDGQTLPAKYGRYAITLNYPNPIDQAEAKTGSGIWLHGVITEDRIDRKFDTEGCVAFHNNDIEELREWLNPFDGFVVISQKQKDLESELKTHREVYRATESWAQSWQSRSLDQYLSFYHPSAFVSQQSQNYSQYSSHKKSVFGAYKKMDVKLDEFRVLVHDKYAVSLLNQDFNGDNRYFALGRKILYWQKNNQGEWKIVREIFQPRRKVPHIDLVSRKVDPAVGLNQAKELSLPQSNHKVEAL